MFQGYAQTLKIQAPFRGMDTSVSDSTEYAKYLQNMLIGDNNTCHLRYGTRFIAQFPFDPSRIFRSQIAVMSYLGSAGMSEILVYQNYLTAIPYIDIKKDITLEEFCNKPNITRVTINMSSLNSAQKLFLERRIYEGVYIYVRQESRSDGAYIQDLQITNTNIVFTIGFPKEFFDRNLDSALQINNFELWFERAAIYKKDGNKFNPQSLLEDLDPNVIISNVNYQGKLLIANGVNPVYVYDGNSIKELIGTTSLFTKEDAKLSGNNLTFLIDEFYKEELEKHVIKNTKLIITKREGHSDKTCPITVKKVTYDRVMDAVIKVTVTVKEKQPNINTIKLIEYFKKIPCFNFLAVANDRLWALAEGRSYKNKFRPTDLAMKVYFCVKLQSVHHWFNQQTGELEFIDLSTNTAIPDNLETIIPFQGKILFLGRETTQIWSGFEPMTIDDGQSVTLPDFNWEMTLPVGILQKSLYVEIPNDFLFLSKYGIMSVSSINEYQQLAVSYNFANSINQHLNAQLAFIEDDRDYRALQAFLYPYGRFLGFKLKYNCMVYQLKKDGAWSIFSENFADSRSFFYDSVSQDLFLGMDDGILLAYADKIQTQTYEEYGKGAIIWRIHYNWTSTPSSWYNEAVFIACRTLTSLKVNLQIYIDGNDAEHFTETISVEQEGGLYDSAEFSIASYSYRENDFPYEVLRFSSDSMMIALSGKASNQFVFDKLFLAGGLAYGN